MHGGVILGSDRERQFLEAQTAQSVRGGLHQGAAQSVALETRLDTDLGGVANPFGNFAGQHGADQVVAARMPQHKRSARLELSAARQQDDVLQEFQRAVSRAVLIVDVAINVIRVRQINQLGAWLKVAVVPAIQPQSGIDARRALGVLSPGPAA